ncbi:protein tyrosine phosphatase [Lysinibacillus sphaericus]|uniref:low molecular weight protein arginine phosphatase n=1 Tax=Lysinibacillus sphaericus TaxID=1421 RepID=UPI0018CCDCBE|nr:low molecular weight protein arginine phosphatase [Lysinibacillus sphaericus]MBG9454739.1 protein tyrosine phosphatase [Lysinibacillus sphaericus]MBG9478167.1 protein tyrosine phosphatase [Lysinibacillus sphaericus]MBG9590880.1 protein tyrosine phosphatase [Lysinibacillus sphaericus]
MKILFVCTGNTCRSPMAEVILKHKQLDNVEVRSAGIYAMPNAEMSAHAQQVLYEENMMHQHLATQLSITEMEWADLILTMTTAHKDTIIANFPNAEQKVFTLKEYTSEVSGGNVVDPYGGSIGIYKETFAELTKLVERLAKKIEEN